MAIYEGHNSISKPMKVFHCLWWLISSYCLLMSCIIKLRINHLPVMVEVIGRPVHRKASIVSLYLRYEMYTHTICLKQSPVMIVDRCNGKPPASSNLALVHSHRWLLVKIIVMVSNNQPLATNK